MKRNRIGFSLWELMVVIALIIMLGLIAIENIFPLLGDAERAAHASTRGTLQSTIGMEATARALNGGMERIRAMQDGNPVGWLQAPISNYVGEIEGDYEDIPPRYWAFDKDAKMLVYRVGFPEFFSGSYVSPPAVRYRVVVNADNDEVPRGVVLEQVDTATWITDQSVLAKWMGTQ